MATGHERKMAQQRLDIFTEIEPSMIEKKTERSILLPSKEISTKRRSALLAPENLVPSYFISASYDGKARKAVIKLYEPASGQIYSWIDNSGHQPYCLTNLSPYELEKISRLTQHPGFDRFEIIEKLDPLEDKVVKVTKVIAKDPLAIGGRPSGCIRDIIPEDFVKMKETGIQPEQIKVWESKIKYYQSYIYDRNLLPGMIYKVKNGNLIQEKLASAEKTVDHIGEAFIGQTAEELNYIERWAELLEYPAPNFKRVAMDIEVTAPVPTRVPDPREATYQVVCVSFYSSDDEKRVLLLKREGVREGDLHVDAGIDVEYYDSEHELLEAVFEVLWKYPFVITFNGDDFDLRYLSNRAQALGIRRKELPIEVGKRVCALAYGVHIDLYKFFFNRSIQIYAYNNRYRDVTLNDVGKALIGMQKISAGKSIADLAYTEIAQYCFRDVEITYKLTSFENDQVMKLILVLTRISSMPMEDVSRQGVSRWIRNFLHYEHRRRNMLIPNPEDILARKGKAATKAIIKGKKYKGAMVVEPISGVHFNVSVMDFPSLYPSIIKVWNLGYQSILCRHPECRKNLVPDTPNWVCTKKRALESLLIGSLRDLRVQLYKGKAKDKTLPSEARSWYSTTQGALKVILNASYGVFGAESFDLYCPPVAEATAAIGRHSITQILRKAEQLGIQVLYGDTDSLFLKNPSKSQIEELVQWTEHELKMGLDVDKVYRYAVFSSRKKNYLGVLEDGAVDVKGLTGKKKHIPTFIKEAFDLMKQALANVKSPADFENTKKHIADIVRDCCLTLRRREWESLDDLAFHVVLGEDLANYKKTTPQHVKAAKMLEEKGADLKAGDLISFVKTIREPHVKPVELASKNEIDVEKYIAYLRSTFDQVLDALGLGFDEIIGLTKLERFM
jgi:DNA polymerase I